MKNCFICLDENIILSCRTCRHGLGGNCFKMLKKCPFCRADFKKKEEEKKEEIRQNFCGNLWQYFNRYFDEMERQEQERIRAIEESRRRRERRLQEQQSLNRKYTEKLKRK